MNSKTGFENKEKQIEKKKSPWKKRFLYGALGGSIVAAFLWLIAMSTNYWVFWILPNNEDVYRPSTRSFLERQYAGLWQVCRRERSNETGETSDYCARMSFFPTFEEIEVDPETDRSVLNYRRASTAIAIIGVFATVIAIAFTWYSIQEPRYIFKRLAGVLLVGCAACILICIEIFQSMISYEKVHLRASYPVRADHKFGFSFGLAWVCFILYLAASLVLFVGSRKKKDKGDHDHPVIIGRI